MVQDMGTSKNGRTKRQVTGPLALHTKDGSQALPGGRGMKSDRLSPSHSHRIALGQLFNLLFPRG